MRKEERHFAILSSLAFTAISCLIVALVTPFKSTQANVATAAGSVIFHVLLLLVLGKRTYDPAILILLRFARSHWWKQTLEKFIDSFLHYWTNVQSNSQNFFCAHFSPPGEGSSLIHRPSFAR
jgi:ABC-type transport system involved in multi-copper enzyme maturation permease subunit